MGGTADHVHLLLHLPAVLAASKAVQLLKGGSSKWINQTFDDMREFRWQAGYGAFSIGFSGIDATRRYIESQEEHHHKKTFDEEYKEILDRHGLEYDQQRL